MEWYELLGKTIKKELRDKNITQRDFIKSIGINEANFSSYLKGTKTPQIDTMLKIAKGLDCSLDYLLGLTNKKSIEPTEDEKAIFRVSELTGLSLECLNKLTKNGESINMYLDNILMLDDSIELIISIYNYLFFKKSDRCDENDEIEFKLYNRTKKEFLVEDYETYKYSFDDYLNLKLLTIQKRLIEMRKSE